MLNNEDTAVIEAIAGNPELVDRVKRIAEQLLGRMEQIVRNGNDQTVVQMASRVMPGLLKAMGDRGQDDSLRQMFMDLREEMRGYQAGVDPVADAVADEDEVPGGGDGGYRPGTGGGALPAPVIRVSTKAMRDRKPAKNPPPPKRSARAKAGQ